MKPYIELTKPRITWLILMSTAVGYWFGSQGPWRWLEFLYALAGTGLLASGTAALNQWYEREADARMRRTMRRPLPAGAVTPAKALAWGAMLSAGGFAALVLGVNLLAGLLGLFTWFSYLFAYTPLKKRSPHATTVGAIPGAMPPLIGYAAATGALSAEAWILCAILFVWQFPHFYSIAWLYREDYARAGIRMRAVVEPDGASTARLILWTSALLVALSLAPALLAMTGSFYLAGALALGLWLLYSGARVEPARGVAGARRVLLASVIYLPALYSLMLLDRPGL